MPDTIPLALPCPALPLLPQRPVNSHKGDYGRALLIGGSRGMSGAIALAGMAAVRVGAGLVRLAVPDRCLETVAQFSPCAMTISLEDDPAGRLTLNSFDSLVPWLEQASCVAIGPGLGQSVDLRALLKRVLRQARTPIVLDADGLNNVAQSSVLHEKLAARLILTPHPGEWARICGVSADDRPGQCGAAVEFARRSGTVVVLKGSQTLVTDGETAVWNTTGTPAMATGGSGDVLTGIITALVCQGLAPRDAAHLGVHVHGRAAELAEKELASHVVLPSELIAFLPQAFHQLAELNRENGVPVSSRSDRS